MSGKVETKMFPNVEITKEILKKSLEKGKEIYCEKEGKDVLLARFQIIISVYIQERK